MANRRVAVLYRRPGGDMHTMLYVPNRHGVRVSSTEPEVASKLFGCARDMRQATARDMAEDFVADAVVGGYMIEDVYV